VQYTDDRHNLRVEISPRQFDLAPDELARMQQALGRVGEAVEGFASAELHVKLIRHPRGGFHAEARLRLPGRSLFSGDWDDELAPAFDRCVRKLLSHVEGYREHPDAAAEERARRLAALNRDVVAPEDPAEGPLGEAARAGDYRAYRRALSGYEEWLRNRVGRWVQRYPEAQARVGDDLRIGDLVEEVFLTAFVRHERRPTVVPLHRWLDQLIDPSLRALLRHPDEAAENASLARTYRDTAPVGGAKSAAQR
jgi:hypothetical protein